MAPTPLTLVMLGHNSETMKTDNINRNESYFNDFLCVNSRESLTNRLYVKKIKHLSVMPPI